MITEEIVSQIRETFAMEPTGDQARAMQVFAEFLVDRDAQACQRHGQAVAAIGTESGAHGSYGQGGEGVLAQ